MNIVPKLQANYHPKDATNLSMVRAHNVMLANDGAVITNENDVVRHSFINDKLVKLYGGADKYSIVGVIPCNDELVFIVKNNDLFVNGVGPASIIRYFEKTNIRDERLVVAYGNAKEKGIKYHGGSIDGAFVYNAEGSLILNIAETDGSVDAPMVTINLGNVDNPDIYNDADLPYEQLSIAPEVRFPNIIDIEYLKGSAYKGWYYVYIRFKINTVDYTQWFDFGKPIYIDELSKTSIIKYCYGQDKRLPNDGSLGAKYINNGADNFGECVGCSDFISSTNEICSKTFAIDISLVEMLKEHKYFQLGFVCASKAYTKGFATDDIPNNGDLYTFVFGRDVVREHPYNDFIIDNNNYYNVGNLACFNNRIYIANYKEDIINQERVAEDFNPDDYQVELVPVEFDNNKDIAYSKSMMLIKNVGEASVGQYEHHTRYGISLADVLGINENKSVAIQGNANIVSIDNTQPDGSITPTFDSQHVEIVNIRDVYIIPKMTKFYINGDNVIQSISSKYNFLDSGNLLIDIITEEYDQQGELMGKKEKLIIFTDAVKINVDDEFIDFNPTKYIIQGDVVYNNTNTTFDYRIRKDVLVPGEVYNFYVHYVDKYGHASQGHRLNNNVHWYTENAHDVEVVAIKIPARNNVYAVFPYDGNVVKKIGDKYFGNIDSIVGYYQTANNATTRFEDKLRLTEQQKKEYDYKVHTIIDKFAFYTYADLRWFQIADSTDITTFMPFVNSNGERLFKVPSGKIDSYNNKDIYFTARFAGIIPPSPYIGWYISYEKFEPTKRAQGILTKSDYFTQDYVEAEDDANANITLGKSNTGSASHCFIYSDEFDIADTIQLDCNAISIDAINIWDKEDVKTYDYIQRTNAYEYCWDMNKPQILPSAHIGHFAPIADFALVVGGAALDNRYGLGTALKLKNDLGLFETYNTTSQENNKIRIYKVTAYNLTRNLYISTDKKLIRCSNIVYDDFANQGTTIYGNGYVTYAGVLIYNNDGVVFNDGDNTVYRATGNSRYYPKDITGYRPFTKNISFAAYMQYRIVDTVIHESKCFKNAPDNKVYYIKQDKDKPERANENNRFDFGTFVAPVDSIDLFENRQGSWDDFVLRTNLNFRVDRISVNEFNKTIRRSAVIQDETRANGWRTFPNEAYKNITENKGDITNLVSIGNILLVHTRHSLFMFGGNDTLAAVDKDIKLAQPDIFETTYKEVLTSELGFGGLQDGKAWVLGPYGYVFYNNDFNRIYRFDANKLDNIDEDVLLWLDKYVPTNVRFGDDKQNQRLVISMIIGDQRKETISYNYATGHFISWHSYWFNYAYCTKTNLYMFAGNDDTGSDITIYNFDKTLATYGSSEMNVGVTGQKKTNTSRVDFVVNAQYMSVKYLEYISYKLFKLVEPADGDYTYSPVEGHREPYAGQRLAVYNNLVNTGLIDISVDSEDAKNMFAAYDKPYWELGNWNFNYLRDKVNDEANRNHDDLDSRLYGNYFVISFEWDNVDYSRIEFEDLVYNMVE